ncbi:MAG TPA: Tad domain-containing protein [Candidatus Eisenbacteria bacterium]|nr:Tad domain-containing protein [Candidatus Eisenbacteria bacterium]
MSPPSAPPRRERGIVIVYLAFFIVFLLGFLGLAVDATKLVATRTQLQRAADAAALAGASAINLETGTIDPDTAIVRALETGALNKAFEDGSTPVLVDPADVQFPQPLQVKVTVRREIGAGGSIITYIARAIGVTDLEMRADATAEADTAAKPCDGLVPMGPVEPPNSGWFDPDCSRDYELKVGSGEGEQGNYQLLDYPPCNEGPCTGLNGGAAVRCYAEYGYGCCLEEGQEFTLTEPGNKVGPFRQGMQARFDADTDRRQNICYDEYAGNGNRVIPLPVIETFDVNGKKFVRIIKFSAFFIKQRPPGNGTLTGQFVNDVTPGEGGGSGGGTLYVLRLVE